MNGIEQAWTAFTQDDYPLAERLFKAILADVDDGETMRQAQFGLGYVLAFTGRFDDARTLFTQLRDEAKKRGALNEEHRALHQMGMVARMAGRWLQAQQTFAEEAQLIEQMGQPSLPVAVNAYEQGFVALHLNEFELAFTWLSRSLEQARCTPDLVAIGCAYRGLGDYFEKVGHAEQARQAWQDAMLHFDKAGEEKAVTEVQHRLNLLSERRAPLRE